MLVCPVLGDEGGTGQQAVGHVGALEARSLGPSVHMLPCAVTRPSNDAALSGQWIIAPESSRR